MRRTTALGLRVQGFTFEQIGAKLGISKQSAHARVQAELAEAAAERRAFAHQVIDQELERIDFVLRSLAAKVAKGDPKAATAFLRAMERAAKLQGLDAAEKHDVSGALTTDPTALHGRLGAIAARAALGADAEGPGEAERDGSG